MTALDDRWLAPPANLLLRRDDAHVWRARLDLPAARLQAYAQTLTDDERARAERFRFAHDRARFIVARGVLRALLGRYLNREARTLRFTYNEYGKPTLVSEPGGTAPSFNLAHSHTLALYAVTRSADIGIDLERIAADAADYESLAERFFSSAEVEALRAVPAERKQAAFLNCWTRKEAYSKARGLGLSLPLSQFDVSLAPGEPAALLASREAGQHASAWALYHLAPGPDYAAALAVRGKRASVICWQWPE